jgi:hypothetical protein
MVLQILTHRKIGPSFDSYVAQMRCGSDAREHEHLRRIEHAPAENDLTRRLGLLCLALVNEFHPGRGASAQDHPAHHGACQ